MSNPTLGIAITSINEDIHMAVSITQFYFVAEDIVVVDGGSTDKTVQIASQLGARVFNRPFDFHYSNQKNFALSQLKTDWIYVHEPDERVEPSLLALFPKLLTPEGQQELVQEEILQSFIEPYDCFGFARKTFIDGEQVVDYPNYQYRLFRNYCKFVKPTREEIVGFKNRTEVDYQNNSLATPARLNLLHYESKERQEQQEILFKQIERKYNA